MEDSLSCDTDKEILQGIQQDWHHTKLINIPKNVPLNHQQMFVDLKGRQLVGADAGADTGAAGSTVV